MIGLFRNLKRLLVGQQVIMLKVIKNLSSASNTLETLDSVGTIELLADFLIINAKNAHYKVPHPSYFVDVRKSQIKSLAHSSISVGSINRVKRKWRWQAWFRSSNKSSKPNDLSRSLPCPSSAISPMLGRRVGNYCGNMIVSICISTS